MGRLSKQAKDLININMNQNNKLNKNLINIIT